MTHTIDLRPRLRLAAEALIEHGWTTGTERDDTGQMCLTGAVMYCAPQNGDEHIIREVLRKRDRAERWNDSYASGAEEVIGYLRTADITDADLIDTFGPQALEIVAQIRAMYGLKAEQWDRLAAPWNAAHGAARDAAWSAAHGAARVAAQDAAWSAARSAARNAAQVAAWNAAAALSTRDLIGQHGYTQAHYDLLTGPWRKVVGKIHPDDEDLFEGEGVPA